ncbi:hypothetical protein QYF36_000494 [Acer negundo]|nr:hypothetical protein QYF36_000494 [Acer negundo]
MGEELDTYTTFNLGNKLDLVRQISRDSLALPIDNVLLKDTFHGTSASASSSSSDDVDADADSRDGLLLSNSRDVV